MNSFDRLTEAGQREMIVYTIYSHSRNISNFSTKRRITEQPVLVCDDNDVDVQYTIQEALYW